MPIVRLPKNTTVNLPTLAKKVTDATGSLYPTDGHFDFNIGHLLPIHMKGTTNVNWQF